MLNIHEDQSNVINIGQDKAAPNLAFGDDSAHNEMLVFAYVVTRRARADIILRKLRKLKQKFGIPNETPIHCRVLFNEHQRAKAGLSHMTVNNVTQLIHHVITLINENDLLVKYGFARPNNWKQIFEGKDQITLYLSSPSSFNDPWDCRPWFDLRVLDTPAERDAQIAWFFRNNPNTGNEEELRANPLLLRAMIEQSSEGIWEVLSKEYRLYCLTPKSDNALMWAHYGDHHQGVCLKFDVRTAPIDIAYKVEYQPTLPASKLAEEDVEAAIKALLTKSDEWAYEEEFRIVAKDVAYPEAEFPITTNNVLQLPRSALIGVVVGCQCKGADEILEWIERYNPRLSLEKAIRKPHEYSLGFETIYQGR